MYPVTLTWAEVYQAALCGVFRHAMGVRGCWQDQYGADPENGWAIHIEGAAGEMAFAKWSGRYWGASIKTFHLPDVGAIQIRTRSKHHYDLMLRPRDSDDEIFVLVTGLAPDFVIRGWIIGRDGKRPEWWKNHANRPHAWFVPQSVLHDPMLLMHGNHKGATDDLFGNL